MRVNIFPPSRPAHTITITISIAGKSMRLKVPAIDHPKIDYTQLIGSVVDSLESTADARAPWDDCPF